MSKEIKCDVKSCKYNDDKFCELEKLYISCICDKEKCLDREETICKSFEKRDENDDEIEELEYNETVLVEGIKEI